MLQSGTQGLYRTFYKVNQRQVTVSSVVQFPNFEEKSNEGTVLAQMLSYWFS